MSRATALLPQWLVHYNKADLRYDLVGGLTVATMLVPQGMAYAMLAGLPPVIGLYASSLPLIAYALFGSSRHLAVGPVAMVSLLVFTACSKITAPGSTQYLSAVLLLTLMVAGLQLTAGILRLGFLVNFFSHAVISGFTSAAAIIIALSQLKHLLGIKLEDVHSTFGLLSEVASHLWETNLATFAIGATAIVGLLVLKRTFPRFPAPIVFVMVGTLLVYAFRLHAMGVATVSEVPRGLPSPSTPTLSFASAKSLLPAALAIFFVGYMESIAVAKYVAAKSNYEISANRELIGLGAANLASSLFSGYPVTGGFSRTAVNFQAGTRTQLATVVTASAIILTVVLLTPLFYHLPNAVLAAVIIVAVGGLIDYQEARRLLRLKKADGLTLVVTFVCTLAIGIEQGLLIGLTFSLAVFIWRSSRPHTAELGHLPDEHVFRNLARYPHAKTYPGVLILRIDASLYFANAKFLEDWLRKSISNKPALDWVVMDMSGVNDIDAVAISVLERAMENFEHRGVRFAFAAMKGPVRDLVEKADWGREYAPHINYPSIEHALSGIGVQT